MTDISSLTQIDSLADNDFLYVRDASTPSDPDKKIAGSQLRPPGSKVTNYFRYAGAIVLPAIAAGVEADVTIAVTGAVVGDHALFNLQDALPANLIICYSRVSAADTVQVRFRNLHASTGYAGGSLLCTALVIRTTA